MSSAAFESISHVKTLDLSYNTLAYIARGTFKNLAKNLERLNLEENIFHAIPAALRSKNGTHLANEREQIGPRLKEVLIDLSLAYNRLKIIPTKALNGMVRLQHLDLSKNSIKQLDRLAFSTHSNLVHLNLAGNHLKSRSNVFLHMTSLAYLDLSYNKLEKIDPKIFEKLPGLERLYLQNNKLQEYPIHAQQRMQNLRQLNLDNNLIEELPDHLLYSTQRLEHLSLAGNRIHSIGDNVFHSSSSKGLKSLNLALGTRISSISKRAFQLMENLQVLSTNNNPTSHQLTLVFAELKNLRYVDLSNNNIVHILPQAFTSLPLIDTLLLHHNEIERIDKSAFHRVARIETLDLSHNFLKNFTCEQLGSVQTIFNLNLAHNRISQTELTCILRSLVHLDLGYNVLETFKKNTMDGADKMLEIILRGNGILELQSHAFACCPKLSTVDLSHNHLRTIHKDTFSDQVRKKLELDKNMSFSKSRGHKSVTGGVGERKAGGCGLK
ncbi:leucine Rich repeat-containing domain protein [Cooperia oncophora]